MSCLQALDHLKIDYPIIEEIISKLTSLKASGFDIHLCWLPGHVGIRDNECADIGAAKMARRTDMQPCLIPPSDFKPIIRKHITAMWQNTWDETPLNKLHEIAGGRGEGGPCGRSTIGKRKRLRNITSAMGE